MMQIVVAMSDIYDKVIELARRRGFVWPTSECYGSVAGFIDYGPLGAQLKRRIENIWRDFYVIREGYYEIECPTIGAEAIYVASGHVKGFADKMIQCPHCGEFHRADHIAEAHGSLNAGILTAIELVGVLSKLPCPTCGETLGETEVFHFNLMFETSIGPGTQRKGYLRPETAQGIFTDFNRLVRFYRNKLPFGAVQIGKSYRNEISPRQGMIRLREFTQAEAEIFVHPDHKTHPNFQLYADYSVPLYSISEQENSGTAIPHTMSEAVEAGRIANEYVAYYLALTHDMLVYMGMNPQKLRFRQHLPDERAHYAEDCWDVEAFSERFGWVEIVGIADRTDYDLKAHAAMSGDSFTVFIPFEETRLEKRTRLIPNMGALGPKFRGKAKAIAEALSESEPGEEGVWVDVENENIFISPDLYEVREEEVEIRGMEVMPHVIEPSYGIDRMLYTILEHSYGEEMVEDEVRRVLRFPPHIAPVQVAVFPLMARDGLDARAREILRVLSSRGMLVQYDDNGAIGRRYRRQDEVGTPFAVTVDYDTMEDNTVTLRDRDTMHQIRCSIDELPEILGSLVDGSVSFASLMQ
jgi:glycyl-tRNA synthetase